MQKFRTFYLLGIGLLFLLSCYILPPIFQLSNSKTTDKVQDLVLTLERTATEELKELKAKLDQGAEFNPKYNYNKKEKTFLAYQGDSLTFWTDDNSTFNLKELQSKK